MTGILEDVLHDRADSLAAPDLDVAAMVRDGERRARRGRVGVIAAVAASVAVVGALAVPAVLPDREPGSTVAVQPRAEPLVYAVGTSIHDGDTVIDTGVRIRALVQTESGYVVSDAAGDVLVVSGEGTDRVGRLADGEHPRFQTDGDLVAWVDASDGGSIAALDVSEGTTVEVALASWPGRTVVAGVERELGGAAQVAAVDGRTVYVSDRRGVLAWDPFGSGGTSLVAGPDGAEVEVVDVQNGVFAYHVRGGTPAAKTEEFRVGTDLRTGRVLPVWGGRLSPDGGHLISETADVNHVYDTADGRRLPFDEGGYAFLVGYRWLDEDTYAGLGLATMESTTPDLLTCEVATGACTLAVGRPASVEDGLVLPISEGW
ncbi:hypothetical protein [Nocardioides sp. Soil805]|uniref:hypothetical protein n=1 Tax=Nocardioides sp. Soil805 TaxID=1736416 RepID=UPI000702BA86|nr:hypothetical protein [Nocardioides sp. Soil805]KRF36002.1 hypothetical protein ASG94_00445 [Nocardioides sp. Soil805]